MNRARNRHAPFSRPPFGPALAAVAACIALLAPSLSRAQVWAGKETVADGVLHVRNPREPLHATPTDLRLRELWRLGGETEDEDEFFGVISHIAVDPDGTVYLLDAQLTEVKVFSSDGVYLNTIGREGEGPGEFRRPNGLLLTADGSVGVLQRRPGKIVLLTPGGDPAGELTVRLSDGGGFVTLYGGHRAGEQMVVRVMQWARHDNGGVLTTSLLRIDETGTPSARYVESTREMNHTSRVINEREFRDAGLVWNVGRDGRVYASDDYEAYRIQVWDPDGTLRTVIERDYESRRRSSAEIDRVREQIRPRSRHLRNARLEMSETDRDVMQIFPRDDGSLWVLSSRGALDTEDGVLATLDVFDERGRFVRQLELEGEGNLRDDGIFLVGNRLFLVTGLTDAVIAMRGGSGEELEEGDGEIEPLAVICYSLPGPVASN